MNSFAGKVFGFYKELDLNINLPTGVSYMNPYRDQETLSVVKNFLEKYFNDPKKRTLLMGINPGRFGAGITGISFTDPVRLAENCSIENNFDKKPELSSSFIYEMIDHYGGPGKFYKDFFISSISPLGFVMNGKNMNYYDSKELQDSLEIFVIENIQKHMDFGIERSACFCIGEGKNHKYLTELNKKHRFFEKIIPLAHPRFIMQYRRKQKSEYIEKYISQLSRTI